MAILYFIEIVIFGLSAKQTDINKYLKITMRHACEGKYDEPFTNDHQ